MHIHSYFTKMNSLRDMLNEFYETIPYWLRDDINNAINLADNAHEERVITPLSTLISLLGQGFMPTEAVNRYMTDPMTRHSVTRPLFFRHTLYQNLYQEDRRFYYLPNQPTERLSLAPSPAIPLEHFQSEAFVADPDDDFFDELSPHAPSNQALIIALQHPHQ